jgi:hypothetical protein
VNKFTTRLFPPLSSWAAPAAAVRKGQAYAKSTHLLRHSPHPKRIENETKTIDSNQYFASDQALPVGSVVVQ